MKFPARTGVSLKILLTIGAIAALAGPDVAAYTIYRCETDRGVIFSKNHCGEGAVRLSAKNPERPRFEPADDSQILLPALGPETFERLSSATTEQILRQTGQPAAALRQYQLCVQILEEELGVSPTATTTTLYEQIRAGKIEQARPGAAVPPAKARRFRVLTDGGSYASRSD